MMLVQSTSVPAVRLKEKGLTLEARFAPVGEAGRAVVRASFNFALAVWRFFFPAVHCAACNLGSILVRHTCGRDDYLRQPNRRDRGAA